LKAWRWLSPTYPLNYFSWNIWNSWGQLKVAAVVWYQSTWRGYRQGWWPDVKREYSTEGRLELSHCKGYVRDSHWRLEKSSFLFLTFQRSFAGSTNAEIHYIPRTSDRLLRIIRIEGCKSHLGGETLVCFLEREILAFSCH
jgi:hypothetical protein